MSCYSGLFAVEIGSATNLIDGFFLQPLWWVCSGLQVHRAVQNFLNNLFSVAYFEYCAIMLPWEGVMMERQP